MERPELTGVRRLGKDLFDKVSAGLGALFLLPALLTIALAVKVTSPGPVFFRQQRLGRDGQTFSMLKFRSMVAGADRMVDELEADSDGNGVLFKKKDDPRITRVGSFLRRYSLDELPQLVNVLRGDMSLVGPRPPLPSEVERYGFDMHRRFLVKPGLTGLWQVSGRSDLSWDDSVRIDVRYVENWSLTFDFMILWKTVGAVLTPTFAGRTWKGPRWAWHRRNRRRGPVLRRTPRGSDCAPVQPRSSSAFAEDIGEIRMNCVPVLAASKHTGACCGPIHGRPAVPPTEHAGDSPQWVTEGA
jgi:lipopolysaccharide/colanic/teichoic acid biosynthesis glycosyltransferase